MGKQSGEQARRVVRGLAASERYGRAMLTRDKLRLVKALRDTANRLEMEAKGEAARLKAVRVECSSLAVTDHALVRFLERVVGIDMDAVRAEIGRLLPPGKLTFGGSATGEHTIHVRDGFQFLATPLAVISVLSPGMEARDWLERDDLESLGAA